MGFLERIGSAIRPAKAKLTSEPANTSNMGSPFDLSVEQKAFWDENGYLVLKNVLNESQIRAVLALVDDEWTNRSGNDHHVDVLSGPMAGQSWPMEAIDPSMRGEVYKLNNLFVRRSLIRETALHPTISGALKSILGGEPTICNSLNFERGSQQPYHLDTWYMPPPVDDMMVAANIALEPMTADNGPFVYYPGSHKIEPYRFSHGRLNIVDEEVAACVDYIQDEIQKRNLKPQSFSCEAGDVFLWHAQLFHGGSPIKNMQLTRNSLVVHYWRDIDMPRADVLRDATGSYLRRTLRGEISV